MATVSDRHSNSGFKKVCHLVRCRQQSWILTIVPPRGWWSVALSSLKPTLGCGVAWCIVKASFLSYACKCFLWVFVRGTLLRRKEKESDDGGTECLGNCPESNALSAPTRSVSSALGSTLSRNPVCIYKARQAPSSSHEPTRQLVES